VQAAIVSLAILTLSLEFHLIRIVIADSHRSMREGLKRILEEKHGMVVVAEATNWQEAVDVTRNVDCDVILLELAMPGCPGADLVGQIRVTAPRLPILLLSCENAERACGAIRAGANGYVNKGCVSEELLRAIHYLVSGRPYISVAVAAQIIMDIKRDRSVPEYINLPEREQQVLGLLAGGLTITEIADELCLSVKTITMHKVRMMSRMNFRSFPELVQYAIVHRIIPLSAEV
jgi:two-component system invasion response regulator UvrY